VFPNSIADYFRLNRWTSFEGRHHRGVVAPLPLEEVPLAQDKKVVAMMNAREKLVARCHVVAERLAGDWRPWSSHDIDMLVQVGEAIAVLDRLIKREPVVVSEPAVSYPPFVTALPEGTDNLIGV
jgi:hypothetical protein